MISYKDIMNELESSKTTLVAVSKTKPVEAILELYHQGQRIFGENKVQEMVEKYELLPKDISWHLIGNLQVNKVKYIAPFVDMIHSVDSVKLADEIQKQAAKHQRTINILIQVKIAQEESKHGVDDTEVSSLLSYISKNCSNITIRGFMGMSTFTDDTVQVQKEFASLSQLFKAQQSHYPDYTILSMGMSGDYPIAIAAGSNMVRIGSLLFGNRS